MQHWTLRSAEGILMVLPRPRRSLYSFYATSNSSILIPPFCLAYAKESMSVREVGWTSQVVGLDMDYTLIHYDVNAWEGKAFAEGVANLQEMGCPVEGLTFQPDLVIRGLIVDKHLGNIVKADRFG